MHTRDDLRTQKRLIVQFHTTKLFIRQFHTLNVFEKCIISLFLHDKHYLLFFSTSQNHAMLKKPFEKKNKVTVNFRVNKN